MPRASWNRRGVLGGIAALGSTAVRARGAGQPLVRDAVVVGAGLAGLHAAHLLEAQGLKVQVVEASDRVGGRLRTHRMEGYRADVGGQEVGPNYRRIRETCTRLQVGLVDTGPQTGGFLLDIGGQLVRPEQWAGSVVNRTRGAEREILPFLMQNKLFFDHVPFDDPAQWLDPEFFEHDVSAAAWLRARGVSEAAIRLAEIDLNGPDMASVSAMSIFRDLARVKVEGFRDPSKPQYGQNTASRAYVEGGSDMLPRAMAASLKTPVRLVSPVAAIDQGGKDVEVRLVSGDRLRCRFVVVAVSFSAVRNIEFTPALPPTQADAVEGAVYSATTQFHFAVEKPYWEADGLPSSLWSDRAYERGFHVANRGGGAHGVLILWLNGDGAMRLNAMDLESQRAMLLAELAAGRPATKGALRPLTHYSWEQNRFVGGNKHCFGAGQVRRFGKDMAKPHGRIHFAGEHLRRTELGMESAMETAEIAATEILARV